MYLLGHMSVQVAPLRVALYMIQINAVLILMQMASQSLRVMSLLSHMKMKSVKRSSQTQDIFGNGFPNHSPPPSPPGRTARAKEH